jgi:hypothetical protein
MTKEKTFDHAEEYIPGRPAYMFNYEVTGMILLRYLKGAMRLGRSKHVSMHISTCTSYNLNALTPVVWKF